MLEPESQPVLGARYVEFGWSTATFARLAGAAQSRPLLTCTAQLHESTLTPKSEGPSRATGSLRTSQILPIPPSTLLKPRLASTDNGIQHAAQRHIRGQEALIQALQAHAEQGGIHRFIQSYTPLEYSYRRLYVSHNPSQDAKSSVEKPCSQARLLIQTCSDMQCNKHWTNDSSTVPGAD